jgi:RHS repeat-associated protein
MTKPLKTPPKTSQRPLFLRKRGLLHPQKGKKPLKTPPAVAYRGIFFKKKYAVKEPDPETGLYYYGARYLDPKTSRWLSGDPALGEYLPVAPLGDEAKKRNQNLPGQGGVFNYVNLHAYHYAGNNPVRYTDPDGRMQKHNDGYVVFDNIADTIHDAWEHGGYGSWQHAAFSLGIHKSYDGKGNWIGKGTEGEALREKKLLLPTEEFRNSYLDNNYPNISEAERYSNEISQSGKNKKNIDIERIASQTILTKVGEKILGFFAKVAGKLLTPSPGLGIGGPGKKKLDVEENNKHLIKLYSLEYMQTDYSKREEARSNASDSITFRNKPYDD